MTVWSPDSSKKIALVSDLAAMASSVDDDIADVITDRQAHTYVWDDDAERSAQDGAPPGSTGIVLSTSQGWTQIGGQFLLTHGVLPTFTVRGKTGGTQNVPHGATATTLNAVWDTPTTNHGFSSWASGVLTIQRAGVYMLNAAVGFDFATAGDRYIALTKAEWTGTGAAFYQKVTLTPIQIGDTIVAVTTIANLAAGDTVKVAVWQTSGSTVPLDPDTPQQNQLAVRYLGPN